MPKIQTRKINKGVRVDLSYGLYYLWKCAQPVSGQVQLGECSAAVQLPRQPGQLVEVQVDLS